MWCHSSQTSLLGCSTTHCVLSRTTWQDTLDVHRSARYPFNPTSPDTSYYSTSCCGLLLVYIVGWMVGDFPIKLFTSTCWLWLIEVDEVWNPEQLLCIGLPATWSPFLQPKEKFDNRESGTGVENSEMAHCRNRCFVPWESKSATFVTYPTPTRLILYKEGKICSL